MEEYIPILVIWDLDGTICDSHMLALNSTNSVLEANGFKRISEEDYKFGSRFPTPKRLSYHAVGNINDPIGISLGLQFDALYVPLVSRENTLLYSGIERLLQVLSSKHLLAVLSNACGEYVRAVLSVNTLNSYFSIAYGADDVSEPKPSPAGLNEIYRQLNVQKENCIYIGDGPGDGDAAKNAGIMSIGVTWGSYEAISIEGKFDMLVDNMNELEDSIDKIIHKMIRRHRVNKHVSWEGSVIDNENMNKIRTDDETWEGTRKVL